MNIIFDLDGTLADAAPRLHYIQNTPKDWDSFFAESDKDTPIAPIIDTFTALVQDTKLDSDGDLVHRHTIEIWSGRSSQCSKETLNWFETHMGLGHDSRITEIERLHMWSTGLIGRCRDEGLFVQVKLRLRLEGHYVNDNLLKGLWLAHSRSFNWCPDLVFEDRDRVVQMWRNEGIQCCQVAPGDF